MTSTPYLAPRSDETVSKVLLDATSTDGVTWGRLGVLLGVPAGTLWDVAHGKPVPRKWRKQLGLGVYRDLYAMPVAELRWAIENRR